MNLIPDNVSKHNNVFDVLKERGFIEQTTNEDAIRKLLDDEKIKFYIGFDPTADCLHVGHFMQVIIMMYMQKYGHTPVVLIGGGTSMIGDPSGRSDMRQMMTCDTIQNNCDCFKVLFDKFIEFDNEYIFDGKVQNKEPEPGKAVAVNNASWLLEPKYVDFIRDVGQHFSVNNMLRAECFKQRLEKGLSFLEFNYMLMQSYDFMVMAKGMDVKMQFGGNDQWSNILGGIELTRKMIGKEVYGMTFSLLTTSEGKKMGKTQKGALWLNPQKTSPFEFFQYWRNVADADVNKCLRMLTFLPMEEVERLSSFEDEKINEAKEVLAYEVTKLVHGKEEAEKALEGAKAAFGGGNNTDNIPTTEMEKKRFENEGEGVVNIIKELGLVSSNGDGFRTIEQGGLRINGEKVTDTHKRVTLDMFEDGKLLIQKGKKKFHMVKID
jgi:tyrosyl-tRNA synthetase